MTRKTFANVTFQVLIVAWILGFVLDLSGRLAEPPGRFFFPGGIGLVYGAHLLYFREEDAEFGGKTRWIRGFGSGEGVAPNTMAFIGAFFILFGLFHIGRYLITGG